MNARLFRAFCVGRNSEFSPGELKISIYSMKLDQSQALHLLNCIYRFFVKKMTLASIKHDTKLTAIVRGGVH